jgi:hypothetical protein
MANQSVAEFAKKLKAFNEKAQAQAEKRLKRICLKAFQSVVQRTPVLTGCARGNWRINFGNVPLRTFSESARDTAGSQTLSTGSAAILGKAKVGEQVNVCNSTPYIIPLEHGYSRQAPEGMVHITIDEIVASFGRISVRR